MTVPTTSPRTNGEYLSERSERNLLVTNGGLLDSVQEPKAIASSPYLPVVALLDRKKQLSP